MKNLLCLLAGTFLIFACSPKVTKIELMNELKTKNFCEGIACEKGVIINENMNRMLLDCLEEAWEPLPNEITLSQLKSIRPDIERCVQIEGEFTPIVSKDRLIFAMMDGDNSERFSQYKSNMSRLELNNSVVECCRTALEKMPPMLTMNQFKSFELEVKKCMFDTFKHSNEEK